MADVPELKSRLTKAKDLTDPVNGNTVGGLTDLQEQVDADNERGYRGIKVDPTPNSHYSQETDPTMSPGHDRIRHTEWDPFRDPEDPTTPTGQLITSSWENNAADTVVPGRAPVENDNGSSGDGSGTTSSSKSKAAKK